MPPSPCTLVRMAAASRNLDSVDRGRSLAHPGEVRVGVAPGVGELAVWESHRRLRQLSSSNPFLTASTSALAAAIRKRSSLCSEVS